MKDSMYRERILGALTSDSHKGWLEGKLDRLDELEARSHREDRSAVMTKTLQDILEPLERLNARVIRALEDK
jgi:hypothetical protein